MEKDFVSEVALHASEEPKQRGDKATRAVILALAFVACLQLGLAFGKPANWDEFYHYSLIHAAWRGEEVALLQAPFVPLYNWVAGLEGSSLDHIRLIRSLIMPFELLLVGAVIAAARKFTDIRTALLCGLAYVTAGYAFTQGLALRADVISASLLMTAIAIALHRRLNLLTLGAVGILTALGFIATIKAALYLPAFLAVAYVRRDEFPRWLWPVCLAGPAAMILAAFAAPELFGSLGPKFAGAADRMFGGGLFPQAMHWVRQSAMASVFTVLTITFAAWLAKGSSPHKAALALLAIPALWPVIYFNSYPYFFAFILPPVAVALAPVIALAAKRYGALALTGVFCLNAVALFLMEPRDRLATQNEVQEIVHETFPAPVTYIDEAGMIGTFPRAIPHFASGWALQNYRERGEPEYGEAIMSEVVPLLLANCLTLDNVFSDNPVGERLLPEDEALLRSNYVRHAGIVMVAGKTLLQGERQENELFAVPGEYRVEGGPVRINGAVHQPGAIVTLKRERYDLANLANAPVTLRWAQAGAPRPSDVTFLDLYSGY